MSMIILGLNDLDMPVASVGMPHAGTVILYLSVLVVPVRCGGLGADHAPRHRRRFRASPKGRRARRSCQISVSAPFYRQSDLKQTTSIAAAATKGEAF